MEWNELEEKFVRTYYKNDMYLKLMDAYNDIMYNRSNLTREQRKEDPSYESLLLLNERCNMKCTYCFERHNHNKLGNMSNETLLNSLNFLNELPNDVTLSLFGGEPTINIRAFKTLSGWLRENKLKSIKNCKITTNAYELGDELLGYLSDISKHIFLDIVVSLDGTQETHDVARVDSQGNGTYIKILNNIKRLREFVPNAIVSTQTTLTNYNIDKWKEIVFNCKQLKGISQFHFINLDDPDMSDDSDTLTKEQLRPIFEFYYNTICGLEDFYDGTYMNLFENSICNPFMLRVVSICGAGWKSFAVRPNGDILPCHKYIDGRSGQTFILGNVNDDMSKFNIPERYINLNTKILEDGAVHNQDGRDCTMCVLKENCKGCTASNELMTGDIMVKSNRVCERTKILAELALEYKEPWLDKEIDKLTNIIEGYIQLHND